MVTPAKGDYLSIPITQAAKDAADAWDPAKDTAAGEQCRSYGAPALMRTPTRLRISWRDDTTLSAESDYGTQTRVLQFAPGRPESDRGRDTRWRRGRVARGRGAAPAANASFGNGSLKVVTTNLRPGYLRKNGVPFSGDTVLTEDLGHVPGAGWSVVARGSRRRRPRSDQPPDGLDYQSALQEGAGRVEVGPRPLVLLRMVTPMFVRTFFIAIFLIAGRGVQRVCPGRHLRHMGGSHARGLDGSLSPASSW